MPTRRRQTGHKHETPNTDWLCYKKKSISDRFWFDGVCACLSVAVCVSVSGWMAMVAFMCVCGVAASLPPWLGVPYLRYRNATPTIVCPNE